MRRFGLTVIVALAATLAWTAFVCAQQAALRGQVRGKVIDSSGKGIPGVAVEMVHEGKPPMKLTLTTDKKGGFIRVGIPDGNYAFTFKKEGYKPHGCKIWISLGGLSEVPDQTLEAIDLGASAAPATGLAGGPAGSSASAPDQAAAFVKVKDLFDKAVAAVSAGQWDDAESLLKECVTVAPSLSAVHYNLGFVYEHKKAWNDAANEYRQAVDLDPARSDSALALARALDASGQKADASKVLEDVASRFDQDAPVQFKVALQSFDSGLSDQAAAAFQKVQALDPANPEPLYFLSMLSLQKGQMAEAVALIEKYVALTGQDPQNLARAKAMLPELQKSLPKR
jgi:Flp pilus assembly protein TadD